MINLGLKMAWSRYLLLVFIFILILPFISAAVLTYTDLNITLKDIETNMPVKPQSIELKFKNLNKGTTINLTEFLDQNSTFKYRIVVGNWLMTVNLDNISTPEKDYTAEKNYLIEENTPTIYDTLYLYPIGSIEGNIISPEGNLIADAEVTVKCKSKKQTVKSDQYGSFKVELMPIGECSVHSAYKGLVGSTMVNVTRGQTAKVNVQLNKTLLSATRGNIYLLIGIIAIIVIAIMTLSYFVLKRIKRKIKQKPRKGKSERTKKGSVRSLKKEIENKQIEDEKNSKAQEVEKEELNPRARDIIKTLNEKERKVVELLLRQKEYKSTQASIRNETGIPKTTLIRVFQSLEAKNIIKIEVIGKLKKIELTSWFLGME